MNSFANFVLVSAFALTASCTGPEPVNPIDGNALPLSNFWKLGMKPVKVAVFDQDSKIHFDKNMDAAFEENKLDAVLFLGSLDGEPEEASHYRQTGNVVVSKDMEMAFDIQEAFMALDLSHSDLHDNCPKKVWFPGFTGFRKCDQLQCSQEEAMIHDKRATIYTIGRVDPKREPPPVPPTADAPMLWTLGCSPIRIAYILNFEEFSGGLAGMAFECQLVSEFKKRKLHAIVFKRDLDSMLVTNPSLYQSGNAIVANSIKDTWTSQVYPVFDFLLSNMHDLRSGKLHSDWSMIGIGTRINGYEAPIYTMQRKCTFWQRNRLWIVLFGLALLAGGYFLYQKRFQSPPHPVLIHAQ